MSGRPPSRKARALLSKGRVAVLELGSRHVIAQVVDDEVGRLVVRYDNGRWSCPCPHGGSCPHLLAVSAVTDLPAHELPAEATA